MEDVLVGQQAETNNSSILQHYVPGIEVFVHPYVSLEDDSVNLLSTATDLNIYAISPDKLKNFVNLKRTNDIRHINKFFESVNEKLATDGVFVGCFESKEQRKQRIFRKFPSVIAYPFYYGVDFIWKRIIPKTRLFHKAYYALTRGHNRVISTPEVLGRLISCGFQILNYRELNGLTYFCAQKVDTPSYDENPTYNAVVTLQRVGKDGKYFDFYKLRTMHPYAEYLQNYVYKKNGTEDGDKFRNDFRVTVWGKLFRRFWIDELPMILNYLKGDIKLVGVRPLSRHKFQTYPKWLQIKRIKYKPGLVPPYYADMPETVEEFMDSESRYLDQYEKSPIKTDTKYFFKALYNILINGARSK